MDLILVDPSPIFRTGLKAALVEASGTESISVLAECSDRATGARLAAELAPDVVVSELQLGEDNGIELARELARTAPTVRVMILAWHGAEAIVHQAVAAGVVGYVMKQETAASVLEALQKVRRGELVLPYGVSEPRSGITRVNDRVPILSRLSRREREVFDLVVWGRTNKDIAQRLGISGKTVETHRGHINRKLRVHTTADIVRLASLLGLLVAAPLLPSTHPSNGVRPQ